MLAQQIKQQIAAFAKQGMTYCHVYLPLVLWQDLVSELGDRCRIVHDKVGEQEIVLATDLGLVHITKHSRSLPLYVID